MRNMNCRNVRREIEEVAPGKWLSSDVNNHVSSCVACETLLREQTKLRELVSSLGTIAAPSDFDFRLRARLADEKRGHIRSFTSGNFSFSFGSAAVATVLLLIGSSLMFVSLRTNSPAPVTAGVAKPAGTVVPNRTVATNSPEVVGGSQTVKPNVIDASMKPADQPTLKRRNGLKQTEVASRRDINSQSTRDLSSTPAPVLRRDQVAALYPSSAFPIDAGYQSLKVSLDDGRGISRTISLPSVSFGSQRSLSQSSSPLIASARDAW
jgi:hypothetical protein